MVFVFAALAEFVIVKVLDKQYQDQKNSLSDSTRLIYMVSWLRPKNSKTPQIDFFAEKFTDEYNVGA